jgi:spore coat protein U-like protein
MRKGYLILTLSLSALGLTDHSDAAISGQIQARLVISSGCEISSGSSAAPGGAVNNFGMLDFGSQGPTWRNPVSADLDNGNNGKLAVTCNPSVTGFNVTIDGGTHGDGTTRRLSNGSQMIPYKIYFDAGRHNDYSIGQQRTFAVTSGAQVPIPVYGAIEVNTSALPAGVYTDTLMVTLDW